MIYLQVTKWAVKLTCLQNPNLGFNKHLYKVVVGDCWSAEVVYSSGFPAKECFTNKCPQTHTDLSPLLYFFSASFSCSIRNSSFIQQSKCHEEPGVRKRVTRKAYNRQRKTKAWLTTAVQKRKSWAEPDEKLRKEIGALPSEAEILIDWYLI